MFFSNIFGSILFLLLSAICKPKVELATYPQAMQNQQQDFIFLNSILC